MNKSEVDDNRYTYSVTWSEDDSEYVGLCAEFPSLSWLAEMPDDANQGIRALVAGVLAEIDRGEPRVLGGPAQ
jgi:hypothetical protein